MKKILFAVVILIAATLLIRFVYRKAAIRRILASGQKFDIEVLKKTSVFGLNKIIQSLPVIEV